MRPNLQAVMGCSFCGEPSNKVFCLIAGMPGPSAFICDTCVSLCSEIVAEKQAMRRLLEQGQIVISKADAERLAWMKTWTASSPEVTRQGEQNG